MLLGGSPFVFEGGGGRANAPCAYVNIDPQVVGLFANIAWVGHVEALEVIEIRHEQGIDIQFLSILQVVLYHPVHGSHSEIVVAELHL